MIIIFKCSFIAVSITIISALVMWYLSRFDYDFQEVYNDGLELFKKDNYKIALNKFQLAIKKFPNKYQAFYNAGLCELKLNNIKKAKEYFESSVKIKPDDYDSQYNLAYIKMLLSEFEDANVDFQKLNEINPNDSDILFNLGYIANEEKQIKDAKRYIAKAIEISPEKKNYKKFYISILQKYFEEFSDITVLNEILDLCLELLVVYPDDEDVMYRIAVAYAQLGDWENSVNYCERLYAKNQNSYLACNQYALALFCKGEMNDAIKMYEKAIDINPDKSDSYINLVFAYDKINDIVSATSLANRFIKKFPNDPAIEIAKDFLNRKAQEQSEEKSKAVDVENQSENNE
ncbi:MAG: tetratricopeptide repeat protein [Candidatus Gastranaerophilales bacterium]|nr:tetratricopeptide repeat protein [Candidatus Gastranaerophilales bacterium]